MKSEAMQPRENLEPAAAAGTGHAGAEAAAKDTPKLGAFKQMYRNRNRLR
jgi:hypothetical protein